MNRASVSVIIPCYRSTETVERAVTSVINQSLPPGEIILVDDASPDDGRTLNTLRFLQQRFSSAVQVKVVALEQNQGPAGARNHGWDAATQDFIALLDADDAWHPEKLSIQYRWHQDHADVALTGTKMLVVDGQQDYRHVVPSCWKSRPVSRMHILQRNPFVTSTVMLKREIPQRFTNGKRHSEDYLLWSQIVLTGGPAFHLDVALSLRFNHPYGDRGLSAQLWRMEKGELDTFRRLYAAGSLRVWEYGSVVPYSFAKYVWRVIRTSAR